MLDFGISFLEKSVRLVGQRDFSQALCNSPSSAGPHWVAWKRAWTHTKTHTHSHNQRLTKAYTLKVIFSTERQSILIYTQMYANCIISVFNTQRALKATYLVWGLRWRERFSVNGDTKLLCVLRRMAVLHMIDIEYFNGFLCLLGAGQAWEWTQRNIVWKSTMILKKNPYNYGNCMI